MVIAIPSTWSQPCVQTPGNGYHHTKHMVMTVPSETIYLQTPGNGYQHTKHMVMTVPSETFLRRQRPHGLMVIMRVSPPRTSSMSSQPSGSAFSPHSITSSYGNNTDLVCGVRALMRLPEESISRVSLDSRDTVHEASGNSPDLD